MQPSPRADTSSLVFPSLRFCICVSFYLPSISNPASYGAQEVYRPGSRVGLSLRRSATVTELLNHADLFLGNTLPYAPLLERPKYCSSLTFSIQSTVLPLRCSRMAMCVIAVLEVAPCQCFSPGGPQTTSPGRISSFGLPSLCTHPHPEVTIRVCPSGWMCHAVRAPGSNVTLTASTRAGSGAWKSGSMRTVPVKYSAGPLPEGCEPLLLSSIPEFLH